MRAGWGCLRTGQSRGCKGCSEGLGDSGYFWLLDIRIGVSNPLLGYLRVSAANCRLGGKREESQKFSCAGKPPLGGVLGVGEGW